MSNPIDNGSRINRSNVTGASVRPQTTERSDNDRVENRNTTTNSDASQQSDRLKAVREAIDNTPEVDSARVESIKQRIAQGEYPLDADRVAERFAEYEKLLND